MAFFCNIFICVSKYLSTSISIYTVVFVCVACYNIEDSRLKVGISRGEPMSQYGYSVAFVKKPGWAGEYRGPWDEKVLLVGAPNKTVTKEVRTKKVTVNGTDRTFTTENASIRGHGEVVKCYFPDKQNWTCAAIDLGISTCEKLRTPDQGQEPGSEKSHCEEDQRMGATIAVNRNFENVMDSTRTRPIMVTICGPGWKNVYFEFKKENYQKFMVGICMKLQDELTQLDCFADGHTDYEYCWPFWPRYGFVFKNGPIFSYAQNGFAADFTRDGMSEITTGPGVDNWKGGFNAHQLGWQKRLTSGQMSTIYYGYSITAAHFKGGANIAVGIPNFYYISYGHFGKVEVLIGTEKVDLVEFGKETGACDGITILTPAKYVEELQMGTKFGASVAAVDITGDGYDELFVGAPLYSGEYPEEGRVFVYTTAAHIHAGFALCGPIGILSGSALKSDLKHMSRYSRFGTSIATAGDLNVDGFNDVAIGAPYEDEGSGAVYIYHGRDLVGATMEDNFVQRIAGRQIDPAIKAFGWHMYGDDDVDGNGFPDLAVGAYASDQAVVLRTRPIVAVYARMDVSPTTIPMNASQLRCSRDGVQLCVDVTVLFRYQVDRLPVKPDGENPFENLTISWELNADTVHKQRDGTSRLEFRDTGGNYRKETISLPPDALEFYAVSKKYILDVKKYKNKPEPKDAWTIVRLEGNFSLAETNDTTFDVLSPVLKQDVDRHIVANAEFDKKCESLDKCVSDLKTSVKLFLLNSGGQVTAVDQSTLLIVGGSTELQMQVDVLNRMNSSYRSNFTADVGLPIRRSVESRYGAIDATCRHDSTRYTSNINCTADSKLDRNENIRVTSFFDTSRAQLIPGGDMDKMRRSVEVDVMAAQANQDVDMSNNDFHASIDVRLQYDVDILEDKETSDQVRYKADESSERLLPIVHRYYVTNNGPSFLPKSYVNITVPLQKDDTVVAIIKKVSSMCLVQGTEPLVQTTTSTTPPTTERVTIPEPEPQRKRREVSVDSLAVSENRPSSGNPTQTNPTQESTKSKNITCVDYVCATIQCKIENLEKNEHVIINVTIDIVEKIIAKEKNTREVRYSTVATVTDPVIWYGGKVVPWDKTVFAKKWTTLIVEPATVVEEVNIWIIIGSVLGALLLLIIVVVILWRCGFFTRKKHTEVRQWKQDSLYKRRSQAPGGSRGSKKVQPPYTSVDKDQ